MTKSKQKRPTHNWAKDQDYRDKLSPEENAWLSQFNSEYYHGEFSKKKKPIHSDHWRSECYHRSNTMKVDAMVGAVYMDEPATEEPIPQKNLEDNCR